jgi:hypothetical protein
MSLSNSKYWYLNNCLHFAKRTVPLQTQGGTNMLAWTNTLAYYGIRKLRFRNVFVVQATGLLLLDFSLK